jgi:hypothetical protein
MELGKNNSKRQNLLVRPQAPSKPRNNIKKNNTNSNASSNGTYRQTNSITNANTNAYLNGMPRRCDIGYLVKKHIKAIMQVLTMSLTEYNMRLMTTKCLNTAVTFMFLFFGLSALEDTMYCDVENVKKRQVFANNMGIVRKMYNDILDTSTQERHVYYLMLTDGHFIKNDNMTKVFFPGHVMVWEKIPGREHKYYIYQSYINEYDFAGSLEFRNSPLLPRSKIEYYLSNIVNFCNTGVWDEKMVKFWKDMTNVDTTEMLGSRPQDAFLVCYRRRKSVHCLKHLENLTKAVLVGLPRHNNSNVYGNSDKYNAEANALSNSEMRREFTSLLKKIEKIKANGI